MSERKMLLSCHSAFSSCARKQEKFANNKKLQFARAAAPVDDDLAIWSVSFDCVAAMFAVDGWVDPAMDITQATTDHAAAIADYINLTMPQPCANYGLRWGGITDEQVKATTTIEKLRIEIATHIRPVISEPLPLMAVRSLIHVA
ncbi:MAG: hypothetical protein ACT4QA_14960 [Panacagrimonas sp.]